MKKFEEYVQAWFQDFLWEQGDKDENLFYNMFVQIGMDEEDIEEGESYYELLQKMSGVEIYTYILSNPVECVKELVPDLNDFLIGMFTECIEDDTCAKYSFVDTLIEDMAYHAQDYSNPLGFFMDLAHGGCQSGMISMLIYHDDCLAFFKEHMVDIQSFKEDLEEEIGEPIMPRDKNIYFFDWICWLTYEELAFKIGRVLFPEDL